MYDLASRAHLSRQLSNSLGGVSLALLSKLLWPFNLEKPLLAVLDLALLNALKSCEELLAYWTWLLLGLGVGKLVAL